jgi:hypothetical protein
MAEENRTPDKKIGEIAHAEEQAKRTTGHLPPHGPGAPHEKEAVRANPDRDPQRRRSANSDTVVEMRDARPGIFLLRAA